jgi:Domain of unknown function (DUF4173)
VELAPPCLDAPKIATRPPKYLAWTRPQAKQTVGLALVVGVLFDQVVHTHLIGLAGALGVVGRRRSPAAEVGQGRPGWQVSRGGWLALAALLAPWLTLRTSPWLIAPTLIAVVVLLILAATPSVSGLLTFLSIGGRVGDAVANGLDAPVEIVHAVGALTPGGSAQQARRSLFGGILGVTIAAFLLALLSSGDAFFASLLGSSAVGARVLDVGLIAFAGLVWFGLVLPSRRAIRPNRPTVKVFGMKPVPQGPSPLFLLPKLGEREVGLIFGCVSVVLSGYVVSLVAGAVGGAEYVERRTGLTYAEYARSGFFQLVAVVAVVGSLLVSSRGIIRTAMARRRLLGLSLTTGLCTLVMVAVSIARLQTYRSVFGLTMLRFSTTVFAGWLAVLMVLIVAVLVRPKWEPLLVTAVVLSAYGTLTVTNWSNPDAIVARENIERVDWIDGGSTPDETDSEANSEGDFDGDYLASELSDDAVPAMVARLDLLAAEQRAALSDRLCARERVGDGWSWNRSRTRADAALAELCGR